MGLLVGMTTCLEVVDVGELGGLGLGRTRHARQLVVHAEEVLEGDGRVGLRLLLDVHLLLGLDRLVQAVGPAAPVHQPAGELVDDDDLAVAHHVVAVALEDVVGLERLVDVVQDLHVLRVVEVVDAELVLDLVDAVVGEGHRPRLLVDDEVDLVLQQRDDRSR